MSHEISSANSKTLWIFLTVCIYLNHLIYGINSNIIGPSLVDLRFVYHTSIDTISFIYPLLSIGFMAGSLVGWSYGYLNRQLVFVFFIGVHSLTTVLVPHLGSMPPLLAVIAFYGCASSVWDSCFSTWLVEMWPQANSAILQSAQFMYGLGTILGPLIVSFYVYGELDNPSNQNDASNQTRSIPIMGNLSTLARQDITPELRESLLTLPFALVGSLQSIAGVCLLIAFFVQPYKKPQAFACQKNPDEATTMRTISLKSESFKRQHSMRPIEFRWAKLILITISVAAFNSCEVNYFYFSPTMFQYIDVRLSAAKSAHLLSVLSAAFAIGRLISVFVSLRVIPDIIIAVHLVLVATSQALLYYYRDNEQLIFIFTALLGYGFSAMWAGLFAFTERHVGLTDRVGSVFCLIIGLLNLVAPMAIGKYFHQTPLILFYVTWCFLAISVVAFACTCTLIAWSDRRRRRAKEHALDQVTYLNSHALIRLSSMASGSGVGQSFRQEETNSDTDVEEYELKNSDHQAQNAY